MGCCQPADFNGSYSYDYHTEKMLISKQITFPKSPHYDLNSVRKTASPKSRKNLDFLYKSPHREIFTKDFQTPKERKTRGKNWYDEEMELNNLLMAFQNEDFSFLFSFVKSERALKESFMNIAHIWAPIPETLGQLACVMIGNILTNYLDEDINEILLGQLNYTLEKLENDNVFLDLLYFLEIEIREKKNYKLDHAFLMISILLEFLKGLSLKECEILILILLEFLTAFSLGFKDRKVETLLVVYDILRKTYSKKNDPNSAIIFQNGLLISKTFILVYEISKEMYSLKEQIFFWFRLINFLDEISINDAGNRVEIIVFKFFQGKLDKILKEMKDKIEKILTEEKKDLNNDLAFEKNLLEYINFLLSHLFVNNQQFL